MSTFALLLVIPGAIVGLGLLAVGIWWRSGGKAVRIVLIVVGALMTLLNVGLLGALVIARTSG
jgi:hypothetical protein